MKDFFETLAKASSSNSRAYEGYKEAKNNGGGIWNHVKSQAKHNTSTGQYYQAFTSKSFAEGAGHFLTAMNMAAEENRKAEQARLARQQAQELAKQREIARQQRLEIARLREQERQRKRQEQIKRQNKLNSDLIAELKKGNITAVVKLQGQGAKFTQEAMREVNALLLRSIASGNIPTIKEALRFGANVNAKDVQGKSALELAWGKDDIVKILLAKNNLNLKVRFAGGDTLLMKAIKAQKIALVDEILKKRNIGINAKNKNARVLDLCKTSTDLEVKIINHPDFDIEANKQSFFELLDDWVENVRDPSPLHISNDSFIKPVKAFLVKGAKSLRNTDNKTALELAWNCLQVFNALVEMGVDVNRKFSNDRLPLQMAVLNYPSRVEYLLSKGANINAKDEAGVPFWRYVYATREDMLPMIINHPKFSKELRDLDGNTPLLHLVEEAASCELKEDTVKAQGLSLMLLAKGADSKAKTRDGKSLLEIASTKPELYAKLVKDPKVDVKVKRSNGNTEFEQAIIDGNKARVELLVANGVDPKVKVRGDVSSVALAIMYGKSEIATFLEGKEVRFVSSEDKQRELVYKTIRAGQLGTLKHLVGHIKDAKIEYSDPNITTRYNKDRVVKFVFGAIVIGGVTFFAGGLASLYALYKMGVEMSDGIVDMVGFSSAILCSVTSVYHFFNYMLPSDIVLEGKTTALHIAAQSEHKDVYNWLLVKGVDIDVKDQHGKRAHDYVKSSEKLNWADSVVKGLPGAELHNAKTNQVTLCV